MFRTKGTDAGGAPDRGARSGSVWSQFRRNRAAIAGAVLLVSLIAVAVFAPYLAPHGYDDQDLSRALKAPCGEFPLGTDDFGRDVLSRVIYGSRVSLLVGFVATAISATIGVILGVIAGMAGGRADMAICALLDIAWSFPTVLLAIFLVAVMGPSLANVMIALGLVNWAGYARVVRGQILSLRDQEFVEAARAAGASDVRIARRHLVPNVMAPVIVLATLGLANAIVSESSLSYLGLGAQPPTASWGSMLSGGRAYMTTAWWIATFPGVAIMLSVLAFNLLGDGLRDALDPRLRR